MKAIRSLRRRTTFNFFYLGYNLFNAEDHFTSSSSSAVIALSLTPREDNC